jgi:hypothetical protein
VKAQRQRKKVEALFAELKNQIGLRRLRLRRIKFVREQFFLAAAAQKTQLPQLWPPIVDLNPFRGKPCANRFWTVTRNANQRMIVSYM